jgi:hypothetical protein
MLCWMLPWKLRTKPKHVWPNVCILLCTVLVHLLENVGRFVLLHLYQLCRTGCFAPANMCAVSLLVIWFTKHIQCIDKSSYVTEQQYIDWLIVFWVRDLTASKHLGFNWLFVPRVNQRSPEAPLKFQMAHKLREPCSFNKAPDGPDT